MPVDVPMLFVTGGKTLFIKSPKALWSSLVKIIYTIKILVVIVHIKCYMSKMY